MGPGYIVAPEVQKLSLKCTDNNAQNHPNCQLLSTVSQSVNKD